ncbi:uncharacterized protein [Haliotis cracherodii]|uniref:uncharacterized protein isoform X1 n=1 Tax=Haliotis cracherodii TaxID=6455 RepID=UPI0039E78132
MLFSSNHGINIVLSENNSVASWLLKQHQGLCITNKPMLKEDIVNLTVQGSGHLAIGFLQTLPHDLISTGDGGSLQEGVHWHRFRFKKDHLVISLQRASAQTVTVHQGKELVDTVEHRHLSKGAGLWVCLDVQSGDMKIKIDSETSQNQGCGFLMNAPRTIAFSETSGPNIVISNGATCAGLVKPYGGALCVIDHPLKKGEAIHFSIAQMNFTSVAYVKVFLTNIIPVLLTLNSSVDTTGRLFPLFSIDVDADLDVKLQIKGDGRVTYRVMTVKKSATVHGLDLARPVFVCIQLYQVKVKLTPPPDTNNTDYGSVPSTPLALRPIHSSPPSIGRPPRDTLVKKP